MPHRYKCPARCRLLWIKDESISSPKRLIPRYIMWHRVPLFSHLPVGCKYDYVRSYAYQPRSPCFSAFPFSLRGKFYEWNHLQYCGVMITKGRWAAEFRWYIQYMQRYGCRFDVSAKGNDHLWLLYGSEGHGIDSWIACRKRLIKTGPFPRIMSSFFFTAAS